MRIDQLLVRRGLASTRSQAQRLIAAGVSWNQDGAWKRVAKNGDEVPDEAEIVLEDSSEARFVSRGGLKLDGALEHLGLSVAGALCLDVGQSTGGFTDCLLQRGATHVVGVDVGYGQLHPQLQADARVTCIERVNARHLDAEFQASVAAVFAQHGGSSNVDAMPAATLVGEAAAQQAEGKTGFDLVVGDLSFISQTLVLPAVAPLVRPGGAMLMLVKPQFELQPGQVGKGGVVRDASLYAVVEQRIREAHHAAGLVVPAYFESSIQGGDGNREFFVYSNRS